jgi:hypothetical protein
VSISPYNVLFQQNSRLRATDFNVAVCPPRLDAGRIQPPLGAPLEDRGSEAAQAQSADMLNCRALL